MVPFRCLAVAAALCYEVNAGPCRPYRGSTTVTESSGATLTYESSVLVDTTAQTPTSITHPSVETVSSSDISTSLAVATTNTWPDETVTNAVLSSTSGDETSAPRETTDAETSSLTTEQKETTTTQADNSSEDPSVTVSHRPSAGIETSSAETSSFETSSTVPSSIETTSAERTNFETTSAQLSTTSTTEETTTTSTASAEPQPTNYFLNGGFEIPDDSGAYTGAPSLLGRSVTVKTDSSHALSGTHYAELAYPIVGSTGAVAYTFRQTIAGLDPAKRYVYTYNWAPVNMVANPGTSPSLQFTSYVGNLLYEYNYRGEVSPADTYVKRNLVFGGTGSVMDNVQTRVTFNNLASGSVLFDDISIIEYDPPAKLISPKPNNKWCGLMGSPYGLSNKDKLLIYDPSISLEDCVQSCHQEPTCQVISYVPAFGNNIGRCWRYKVPREDIEFVENNGGMHYVYEPECFTFK
ncbi:hypothetical protein FSPOR_8033 [Fusarium sporotrichioides]|uniref:Apple domain-containing protein n=1 Tax=Fusarium sporotrichioides TaxID=5514 RepID=A0A395RW29_FUSSP|nr:hypothetical protein FSPOR_8033 [Fusarium sporotrichioides]